MFLKRVKCNTIKCECNKTSNYKVSASCDIKGDETFELWEDSGDGWVFISNFPDMEQGYYCYDCYEKGESK